MGKKPRVPDTDDPKIAQRQFQVYEYYVLGHTQVAIARSMGIARETVAMDIRMEGERRALDTIADRQTMITTSVERYQRVIQGCLANAQACENEAYEWTLDPATGQRKKGKLVEPKFMAAAALQYGEVTKAQRAIDRVQGLTAVLPPGAAGAAGPVPATVQNIITVVLESLPAEQRLASLRALSDEAKALGVLPAQTALAK